MQGLICSGIEESFVAFLSTGFRSKGECDSTSSAAKRQGYAVGSNRLSAPWSSGRWDRTPPGAFQLRNGCILVRPPHGQFAIRQTDLHHNFMGLGITLRPIHNQAGWVDLAEFPGEGAAYLRQAFGSCRTTVDRTREGCQSSQYPQLSCRTGKRFSPSR